MVKKEGKDMSHIRSLPRNQESLFTNSCHVYTFQYKCRISQLYQVPKTYSELFQISKIERFPKIVNGFEPFLV